MSLKWQLNLLAEVTWLGGTAPKIYLEERFINCRGCMYVDQILKIIPGAEQIKRA